MHAHHAVGTAGVCWHENVPLMDEENCTVLALPIPCYHRFACPEPAPAPLGATRLTMFGFTPLRAFAAALLVQVSVTRLLRARRAGGPRPGAAADSCCSACGRVAALPPPTSPPPSLAPPAADCACRRHTHHCQHPAEPGRRLPAQHKRQHVPVSRPGCRRRTLPHTVPVAAMPAPFKPHPPALLPPTSTSPCRFIEVTAGFSLFFSLLLAIAGVAAAQQQPPTPPALADEATSVSAFAILWWIVAALTATIRGQQASDAGLPESSARAAVAALSWLLLAAFIAAWAAATYDR